MKRRQVLEYWWVLPVGATLGGLGYMFNRAGRILYGKRQAGAPDFRDGPAVRVAVAAQLREPFATLDFSYGGTPAVLMRLPEATPSSVRVHGVEFGAWSRVCTHLGCHVNVLRDLEATALTYNYRPRHPVLGCPCHFSVFDPLREGESVFGQALYPLPRVRLEDRQGVLYATGIEAPPADG